MLAHESGACRGCEGRGRRGRRRRPPCGPRGERRSRPPRSPVRESGDVSRSSAHIRACRAVPPARRAHPWTSPMMSNGPCARRSGRSRAARARRRRRRPPRASFRRRRGGSLPCAAHGATAAVATTDCGRRAGPKSAVGDGGRLRSWQTLSGRFEDDRHRQGSGTAGPARPGACPGFGLDVGGVDDRQPAQRQPLGGDEPEDLEGVLGDGLVVLVVAHHPPAGVRREDFRGQEVPAGERALARAAGADQDDEGQLGDFDGHGETPARANTAICVGEPSASSTGPTGRNRAE